MTLTALQHLFRSAQALADGRPMLVLGSASLLASTFDADICHDPFDELTPIMLDESLGENRAYYRIHSYHADILRDSILDTLPSSWSDRLVPLPDTIAALALEPHDLAAVKLQVGRSMDLQLICELHGLAMIRPECVRERIDLLQIPVELHQRLLASFRSVFELKSALGRLFEKWQYAANLSAPCVPRRF